MLTVWAARQSSSVVVESRSETKYFGCSRVKGQSAATETTKYLEICFYH